jgi:hypothetical protein
LQGGTPLRLWTAIDQCDDFRAPLGCSPVSIGTEHEVG